MKTLNIYQAAKKLFPSGLDLNHYFTLLFEHPEGEWFAPTNRGSEAYSICDQLAWRHLISWRRIPVWHNGSFMGIKTEFYYNKNLDYSEIHKERL